MGLDLVIAFGICFAVVLLGHLAKWIVQNFLSEREAGIAVFSLALGEMIVPSALGIYDSAFGAIAETFGRAVGLAILWWSFFQRRSAHA